MEGGTCGAGEGRAAGRDGREACFAGKLVRFEVVAGLGVVDLLAMGGL